MRSCGIDVSGERSEEGSYQRQSFAIVDHEFSYSPLILPATLKSKVTGDLGQGRRFANRIPRNDRSNVASAKGGFKTSALCCDRGGYIN